MGHSLIHPVNTHWIHFYSKITSPWPWHLGRPQGEIIFQNQVWAWSGLLRVYSPVGTSGLPLLPPDLTRRVSQGRDWDPDHTADVAAWQRTVGGRPVNQLCLFILYITCEWSVWTAFFVREEVDSNHALVSAACPCFRPPLKLPPLAVLFCKKEGFCSLTSTSTDGASLCFENYDSCQRSPLTHKVGL